MTAPEKLARAVPGHIGGSWVWVENNPISGPHEHGKAEHIEAQINTAAEAWKANAVRAEYDERCRLQSIINGFCEALGCKEPEGHEEAEEAAGKAVREAKAEGIQKTLVVLKRWTRCSVGCDSNRWPKPGGAFAPCSCGREEAFARLAEEAF